MEPDYACGTCGSRELSIRPFFTPWDRPDAYGGGDTTWRISCGKGHELVPVLGTEYRVYDGAVAWSVTN
jgi:hypothetical protein